MMTRPQVAHVYVRHKVLIHYQLIKAEWCIYAVNKLVISGSDNGLPPSARQAIIWNNAGLLLIRHLGRSFGESKS